MQSKLSGWDDTIAAIATPPGLGAIGVLRLSGDQSFEIIQKLFPSKQGNYHPPYRRDYFSCSFPCRPKRKLRHSDRKSDVREPTLHFKPIRLQRVFG